MDKVVDVIIMVTKYHIFRCKCQSAVPNTHALMHELLYYEKINAQIAQSMGKRLLHEQKWVTILPIIKNLMSVP